MNDSPARRPLDAFLSQRPDIVLMGPYLVYLALLGLKDVAGPEWVWLFTLVRGAGGLAAVWFVRQHLPPWGPAHLGLAIPAALFAAAGWYYGQYAFDALGAPHRLPLTFLFPGAFELNDPREALGNGALFWTTVVTRIAVASTTVAFVEELFWRAFLLRALIDWHDFEKLPLGAWSLRSFLLTSLLSTIQHPDNWLVSIPCWFFFNALMIWKRSILFMVIVHGLTNLFLYAWVILNVERWDNRSAWMFW